MIMRRVLPEIGVGMKIFVSYSSHDDNKRTALSKALKTSGQEPVVVAARIQPGTPFTVKVMTGVQESDYFVPILTGASFTTQWVNQEIGYAQGIGKPILPIVDEGIIGDLKGFVHAQIDLFRFTAAPGDPRREAASFRRAYLKLIAYLRNQQLCALTSRISPDRLAAGSKYMTHVEFTGSVENGFFDNYVVHRTSSFTDWNWDPQTLPKSSGPGTLNGNVSVMLDYSHSTAGWPRGEFDIHVRLYSHGGLDGVRTVIAENTHTLVIE